jgi:hypothetical protein
MVVFGVTVRSMRVPKTSAGGKLRRLNEFQIRVTSRIRGANAESAG